MPTPAPGPSPLPPMTAGLPPSRGVRWPLVGWAVLVPVMLLGLWQLLTPTVRLILDSMRHRSLVRGLDSSSWVGFGNYADAQLQLLPAFLHTLVMGFLPLIGAAFVAPVIGLLVARGTTVARLVSRGLMAVPLVCVSPAGYALAHRADLLAARPAGPLVWQLGLSLLVAGSAFAFITALGATAFLALGRRPDGSVAWRWVLAVTGVGVAAVLAAAFQLFAVVQATTMGGPGQATTTPLTLAYRTLAAQADAGGGAAISVLTFLPVALLGAGAMALLCALRPQLRVAPAAEGERTWTVSGILGLVLVALLAIVTLSLNASWMFGSAPPAEGPPTIPALPSSFLTGLLAVVIGALGGFAIGWCRPLGRHSEWLLMGVSPWLFAGSGLFVEPAYITAASRGTLGSMFALVSPVWFCVPALVAFTWGAAALRRSPGTGVGSKLATAAGLTGLVGVVTWVLAAQDLFWPLMAGGGRVAAGPVQALMFSQMRGSRGDEVLGTAPIWWLVLMILVAAASLIALDRLRPQAAEQDRTPTG